MRHCSSHGSPVVGRAYHILGRGPSLLCHFVSWLLSFLTGVGNQLHVIGGSPCNDFPSFCMLCDRSSSSYPGLGVGPSSKLVTEGVKNFKGL